MKASGVVAVSLSGLAFAVTMVLVTWYVVFGPAERAFFLILWGTLTGTGSFGPQ